ncbi:MAG: SDR family NAD(P)-dependent oxidoreductase [Kineosporiaceae bacterium]
MTGAGVVVVIGASSGIGRATALAYAGQGASLVLFARSRGRLGDVAKECEAAGGRASVVVGDVLDEAAVASAFEAAARYGPVDVVVHSVAVVAYGTLPQVPRDIWERAVDTSVHGTAVVARAALAAFGDVAPRGTLVVVGSVLGQVTVPYMSAYVTGKWAVRGLVRCLQQENRAHPGIRIALVDPGATDTPIYGLAAAFGGRQGRPPWPVTSPEHVAVRVLQAAEGGRGERGAGPGNPLMRLGFTAAPWVYDRLVGPLMRLGGLQHHETAPHEGNVRRPSEDAGG